MTGANLDGPTPDAPDDGPQIFLTGDGQTFDGDGLKAHADALGVEAVFFAAADERYVELYGRWLALSVSLRCVWGKKCRPAPRLGHGTVVEQCPRQKSMFSGLRAQTLFHRSEIFFRARRALTKKLNGASNSRVTIPLAKRLFFQPFHSGIVTSSGDTFIAKNILQPSPGLQLLPACHRWPFVAPLFALDENSSNPRIPQ